MPDVHALLSASKAHVWLNCTPSARINAEFLEDKKEAAEEGTRAHDQAERLLKGEIIENPDENVLVYVNFIRSIQARHPDAKIYVEKQVDYSHIAPRGFGTSDCIIVTPEILYIVDYKNGVLDVEVEDNPQLKLYALGAVRMLGYKGSTVSLNIVQPKLSPQIKTWETSLYELIQWGNIIKPKAYMAFDGSGVKHAGDWCKWCRFKNLCEEKQREFKEKYIDTFLRSIRR